VERAWRWCRRNPAVATLLVVVVAGSLGIYLKYLEARQSELTALLNLYVSQMSQAHLAWEASQVGRVRELLDAQTPQRTGGHDFRGFEWHYLRRLLHSERLTLRDPDL